MRPKKFVLPCRMDRELNYKFLDEKIIIVSVIGKSQYRAKGCKTDMLGSFLLTDLIDHPTINDETLSEIEGYYDEEDQVVYLHLRGIFDTHNLINQYNDFLSKNECDDFLSAWSHLRDKYARALLVIFQISHIIILTHPTHIFDYSYVHLFRALDIVRQKSSGYLSGHLKSVKGLPDVWMTSARPCPPRVLFYFSTCPAIFRDPESSAKIKKLEHALEDQIYNVLRKHRVITNTSSNSLFAIPANQEFVYINTNSPESDDILGYMMKNLLESCKIAPRQALQQQQQQQQDENENKKPKNRSFQKFLQQHIDLAFTEGFDDNVGRHTVASHFKKPTISQFFLVSGILYKFFVTKKLNPKASKHNSIDKWNPNELHGLLDTDAKFSKSRCSKLMPRAFLVYQDNLPQHYGRAYHETKLRLAEKIYEMHARGPLYHEYFDKLKIECVKYWKNGRQICEALSLTGNPCTHPIHKCLGGDEQETSDEENYDKKIDTNDLISVVHSSGVRYVCACNCGRFQGPREDPYDVKHANYDWFQLLAVKCGCAKLESIEFPIFQPSTHNFTAARLSDAKCKDSFGRYDFSTSREKIQISSSTDSNLDNNEGYSDESEGNSELSNNTSAQNERRIIRKINKSSDDADEIIIQVSDNEHDNAKDKLSIKQPSTTEYLPGMLHTDSPVGLLPEFSSWSLINLGPSSLYSHNLGLQHQAGILLNSAFLLPWDVTVRLEHHKERSLFWPMVGDNNNCHSSRNYRGKSYNQNINIFKPSKIDTGKEFTVKIFIGVEYECPRGHRFMASAPDKVLKTTGNGLVKDNANNITSNTADMPLYFPCPCRQSKPLIAQLMRVHVVTPKAPVHVTLNPRVQPGPSPCPIFVTGFEQPIKLSQSAYWILRLPYVYLGENGPYLKPKEPVSLSHGKLLAGMYGITEVIPEKTTVL